MAYEHLDSELAKVYAKFDNAEEKTRRAQARIEKAKTPVGRLSGRIALWASSGDMHDSMEHANMIEGLQRMLAKEAQEQIVTVEED